MVEPDFAEEKIEYSVAGSPEMSFRLLLHSFHVKLGKSRDAPIEAAVLSGRCYFTANNSIYPLFPIGSS